MFVIDENSTAKEIRIFAASLPSYELSSVFRVLENHYDYDLPRYASKADMVECLMGIEKEDLLFALQTVLGTGKDDDGEDDDCEDDEEDINFSDEDTDENDCEDDD